MNGNPNYPFSREQIVLAALLHDIGKFFQRADPKGAAASELLSTKIKNLENNLCPSYNGRYSHKHVLWTAQFFENHRKTFSNLLNIPEKEIDKLLRLSAAHHNPLSFEEKIIQKADHYSSGVDRSTSEEAWKDAEEENDTAWDAFRRIRMRSIFEVIDKNKEPNKEYKYRLPVMDLQLNENYFPEEAVSNLPDYDTLWRKFNEEFSRINRQSFRSFCNTLLFLLEKYTTRVPASTQQFPDVSLYDHLKTTAAFAVCLIDYIHHHQLQQLPSKEDHPFLLVGGDLSGIQKYIYGIIAKNAAKNLKGRSFYLQLLMDNIVQYLLDELHLFDVNIVYSSGGGFYLLAPNTEETREKLSYAEKHLSEKIFEYHESQLYLAIDYVAFGEKNLIDQNESEHIGILWSQLAEKLNLKKRQKHKHILKNRYEALFEPAPITGKEEIDAFDGREIVKDAIQIENELYVSSYNNNIVRLGKKLKSTKYWILSGEKLSYLEKDENNNTIGVNVIGLNYYNYFLSQEDVERARQSLALSADHVRIICFNNENYLPAEIQGKENVYGFCFYGGNDYPVNEFDQPKVFEELAGIRFCDKNQTKTKEKPNLVRLGILRMDVDNLGLIFKEGFAAGQRSFSRYCTLSRNLDYFFKGYLNRIRETGLSTGPSDSNPDAFKEYTQIIYSGGDDLFIVGKWDILLRFAERIREEFRKWTCCSSFTLSGGMAIVPPKFPLLKAALLSEDREKSAKNHRYENSEKNAFAFFDYEEYHPGKIEEIIFNFNWDNEMPAVRTLKEEIKKYLEEKRLPTAFVANTYLLMQMAKFSYNSEKDLYEPAQLPFIWIAAYQFGRLKARIKKDSEVIQFLDKWIKFIFQGRVGGLIQDTRYHALQLLAFAARWAEYENR
ncbi:MAG: type III-A CRISPR-associated protein Cas10/Csm1 [Chitinophagaceae bacterium]|nr:type III-A CRISPR-associated protein Cas10/Csm1 [Chitinophagaceae bacterium]